MERSLLTLAPEQTEVLVLHRGPRRLSGVSFRHGDVVITPASSVKYLGIWLDDNIIFGEHLRKTKEKAGR